MLSGMARSQLMQRITCSRVAGQRLASLALRMSAHFAELEVEPDMQLA